MAATLALIDGGRLLRQLREEAGLGQGDLARMIGHKNPGRLSRLEGVYGERVTLGLAERIRVALEVALSRPVSRGEIFTPDAVAVELRGIRSVRATPATERYDGEIFRQAKRDIAAHALSRGLWTSEQTWMELEVHQSTLWSLNRRGLLPAEETVKIGPLTAHLYLPQRVLAYARGMARSSRRAVRRFRDPTSVFEWALKRGLGVDRARALAARSQDRTGKARRYRAGNAVDRPMEAVHQRWADLLAVELSRQDDGAGLGEVSTELCIRSVALRDYSEHPEVWPRNQWPEARRDPGQLAPTHYSQAAKRIRIALARLEKERIVARDPLERDYRADVLRHVMGCPGAVGQIEMAKAVGCRVPTLLSELAALEAEGLVESQRIERTDRRGRRFHVTAWFPAASPIEIAA